MDTLHERLAKLADDAPTTGAPPAELWARGKRAHRLRFVGLAACLVLVGGVCVGIGDRFAVGEDHREGLPSAGTVGITLPIEYPVGAVLPDLGDTPGPLAAIWLAPPVGGRAPQAVGLVAETGKFGMLPFDLSYTAELSPDGRMIAYDSPMGEVTVHDLVSGEQYSPLTGFEARQGFMWTDATHLIGHRAGGSDVDGWVWEPGTAPKPVNLITYAGTPYLGVYAGRDLQVIDHGGGPLSCSAGDPQALPDLAARGGNDFQGDDELFEVPVLCDVVGVIGSEILLGHWNSDRLPGDWVDPTDGNETVVALDIHGADTPFEHPALRRVVATAGAPVWVKFATDLIGEALDADGSAS